MNYNPVSSTEEKDTESMAPGDEIVEAGRYEKDPELDLARVGDDTSVPNRNIL